jgi:hypothetical protein
MIRSVGFSNNLLIGLGEAEMTNDQRRVVAYLGGLPPSLRFGDRQAKVNALMGVAVGNAREIVRVAVF